MLFYLFINNHLDIFLDFYNNAGELSFPIASLNLSLSFS